MDEEKIEKIVSTIETLEIVDSYLINLEIKIDDENVRRIIKGIREKILSSETLLTEYIISGEIKIH